MKPKFLELFKKEGRIGPVCDALGLARSVVDMWRANDPQFANAMRQRDDDLFENLHLMAVKRAMGFEVPFVLNGQPVLDADGKPVMRQIHSDYLMGKLLEDYRKRAEARERASLEGKFLEMVYQSFMGALKRNAFKACPYCNKPTEFQKRMAQDFKDQFVKLGGALD